MMITTFKRLLGFISPFKGMAALAVLCAMGAIASGIGLMAVAAYLISAAALLPSIAVLQTAIVGVRFFGIARGVFRYLERLSSHWVTLSVLANLRTWFYRRIEPLAPARLISFHSGDLLSIAVADIETLQNFYVRVLSPALVALLVAAGAVLLLTSMSLWLGLALAFFLLLAGLALPLAVRRMSRTSAVRQRAIQAQLSTAMVDTFQGCADLLAFGQEDAQVQKLRLLDSQYGRTQAAQAWIRGLHGGFSTLLSGLGAGAVLVVAVPLVRSGQVQGVYLAALVLGSLAAFEAVQPLPLAMQFLESSLAAAGRLFRLVDTGQGLRPASAGVKADGKGAILSVRNLRFAYPEAPDRPVLDGLNLELLPGQKVALVGASGAGKTTLVSLLLRFWEYQEGEIYLEGRDLRTWDLDDLRSRIAVISQSTHLFNGTIRQNMLLGNPQAAQAQIEEAAHRAQLEDLIQRLPQGYDTWIGEQGLRLSAGEARRLAVARALLRNAPLLILDEPAANLDAQNEARLMEALYSEVFPGRAVLLITHHQAALSHMDAVHDLRNGKIYRQN
ncbi:MAG: thiol reductant ABC exporter subunit CydC [Chloroflexi bacterium]|nr:thiol reductant ABC exporter subunit CydC [Chloroflexota bacterium]